MATKVTQATAKRTIEGSNLSDSTKQRLLSRLQKGESPEVVVTEFKRSGGVPYQTKLQTNFNHR